MHRTLKRKFSPGLTRIRTCRERGGPGSHPRGTSSGLKSKVTSSEMLYFNPTTLAHNRPPSFYRSFSVSANYPVCFRSVFPLQNVSPMTAEGPSSSRLAKRPPFRPGPERPGHGASLAMPRRRPERGANPGGRLAGASCPGPWPGLRDIRLRGSPHRPQPAPPPEVTAARSTQPWAAPCVAPAQRPRPWPAPPAAPYPKPQTRLPAAQYELPAAFANSQLRCSAGPSHPAV